MAKNRQAIRMGLHLYDSLAVLSPLHRFDHPVENKRDRGFIDKAPFAPIYG